MFNIYIAHEEVGWVAILEHEQRQLDVERSVCFTDADSNAVAIFSADFCRYGLQQSVAIRLSPLPN